MLKEIKIQIEPKGYLAVSEKHRTTYMKDEIIGEVKTFRIPYIISAKTVLLFNPKATAQEILDSLDILKKALFLRFYIQEGENPKEDTQ